MDKKTMTFYFSVAVDFEGENTEDEDACVKAEKEALALIEQEGIFTFCDDRTLED